MSAEIRISRSPSATSESEANLSFPSGKFSGNRGRCSHGAAKASKAQDG